MGIFNSLAQQAKKLKQEAKDFYDKQTKDACDKANVKQKTIEFILNNMLGHTSHKLKQPSILGIIGKTKPEKKALKIMLKDNKEIMQQNAENNEEFEAYEHDLETAIMKFMGTGKVDQTIKEVNNRIVSSAIAFLEQGKGEIRKPEDIAMIVAQVADSVAEGYRDEYKNIQKVYINDAVLCEQNCESAVKGIEATKSKVAKENNLEQIQRLDGEKDRLLLDCKNKVEGTRKRLDGLYTRYTFAQAYAESVGDHILLNDSRKDPIKQGFICIFEIMKKEEPSRVEILSAEKGNGAVYRIPLEELSTEANKEAEKAEGERNTGTIEKNTESKLKSGSSQHSNTMEHEGKDI